MFVFHGYIKLGDDHNEAIAKKKDIGIPCRIAGVGNRTWFAKMAGSGKTSGRSIYTGTGLGKN